jgi:hypothetical protein
MAAGLFVEFAGFLYDTLWHDQHLSEVAIPPGKLLTVHGGIYFGELLVLAIALVTLKQRQSRPAVSAALWGVVAGAIIQLAGSGLDMWSHGHGYEKDLYHNTIYVGAALTVIGYLLLEFFGSRQQRTPHSEAEFESTTPRARDTAGH